MEGTAGSPPAADPGSGGRASAFGGRPVKHAAAGSLDERVHLNASLGKQAVAGERLDQRLFERGPLRLEHLDRELLRAVGRVPVPVDVAEQRIDGSGAERQRIVGRAEDAVADKLGTDADLDLA